MLNGKTALKNSVFIYILSFFFIILIIISIIGLLIFSNGLSSITGDVGTLLIQQNNSTLENFENEIKRIKILQFDLFNDESLLNLITQRSMDDYTRVKDILQLQQRLSTIKASSRYIDDVKVHLVGIGQTVSTTTTDAIG